MAVWTRVCDAFLLQEVLQRKAVHDGAEHAHVVAAGPFHAALLQLRPAEEVPATDHDGHLNPTADDLGDLSGHQRDHVGVQPHFPAAEHLPAEFEQHSRVERPARGRCLGAVGAGRLGHQDPRTPRMRSPSRRSSGTAPPILPHGGHTGLPGAGVSRNPDGSAQVGRQQPGRHRLAAVGLIAQVATRTAALQTPPAGWRGYGRA